MATRPTTPSTTLGSLGPSTKVWICAGSAISTLEFARDLEGHETRSLVERLPGDDDLDVLELPGRFQIRHEVGDGRGREGRPADLQLGVLLLEARDPEIARNGVDERIEQDDRLALALGQGFEHADPALGLGQRGPDPRALAQRGLERLQLPVEAIDLAGDLRLFGREAPPEIADTTGGQQEQDPEEEPEIHRRHRQAEGPSPVASLGRGEVDPGHLGSFLSLGRRSARPTATASAGASALRLSP